MLLPVLFSFFTLLFSIYSYFLIDPNITFFQNRYWVIFRDWVVYWGYYRRDVSWGIYLTLTIILFVLHTIAVKKYKNFPILKYVFLIGILLVFSYPFLSHDFFNYMFDARILTHYGKNPYLFKALDFPLDQWTRFMQWTHRTYPYGPTFLPLTLIPSYLGLGKFAPTFFLFKAMWVGLFGLSVFYLNKINKKSAVFFATHPLVIIEGLINGHNDFIAVALGIVGIYLLGKKMNVWSRIFLLFSAGIKYITAPIIVLSPSLRPSRYMKLLFGLQIALIAYASFKMEIQPWYFLSLFVFLPFFPECMERLSLFFAGLLFSYYPYIRLGGWDTTDKVNLKHQIIIPFFILNLFLLFYHYFLKKKFFKR